MFASAGAATGDEARQLAEAAIGKDGLLKAPDNPLCCPFTQQLMQDPVVLGVRI